MGNEVKKSSTSIAADSSTKLNATILALVLGWIGAHKFYIGDSKSGAIRLLFFWTFIPAVAGLYDAFRYATMDVSEFSTVLKEAKSKKDKLIIKFQNERISPGEKIIDHTKAYLGDTFGSGDDKMINGHIILTNQRFVFTGKFLFTERYEQIPIRQIRNLSMESSMLKASIRLNRFKFKSQNKEACVRLFNELEKIHDEYGGTSEQTQSVDKSDSSLDKISKLKELHSAGAITDEEYEAKKSSLLEDI